MGRSTRRAARPSPEIQLATSGPAGEPLYVRLYAHLREHILSGQLATGMRLPSARILAADLRVSRNTVEAAIGQLVAEGFVERRVGSGTVVSPSVLDLAPFVRRRTKSRPVAPAAPSRARLSTRGTAMTRLGVAEIASDAGTQPCAADVRGFPLATWTRVVARHARRMTTRTLEAESSQGLLGLRQQIASYASLARGLRCTAAEVVIVSSTQQAVDLAARVLLDPGDVAALEEPGYASVRAALVAAGARLLPVPVDAHGLDVAALPTGGDVRLVYLTPSHQFPLGVTMSLARRLAVLQWAASCDAWILEDDYDSEFRYDGRPLAALQALDRGDRVLYIGTFNKVLYPGVRLAYLIVPPSLVEAFAAARRVTDGFTPPFIQGVLEEFLRSGQFAAHLRLARRHYRQCRDVMVDEVRRHWGRGVSLGPASTGLHAVAHLPRHVDDVVLASDASGTDVGITALRRYFVGRPTASGLLVSFGAARVDQIARVVRDLAPHVARAVRRPHHRR